MPQTFEDDDRERRVVTSDGTAVGRVQEVDEDRATVERTEDDDSLTDEIKEMLGWNDDDDTHELRQDDVDRREDDRLFLRQRR